MKRISIVFCAVIALTSCSKENSIVKSNASGKTSVKSTARASASMEINGKEAPGESVCPDPAVDCVNLKEVVITSPQKANLALIGSLGNPIDVKNIFQDPDYQYIIDGLSIQLQSQILSGTMYMGVEESVSNTLLLRFGTTFPVTFSNKSFVVNCSYN